MHTETKGGVEAGARPVLDDDKIIGLFRQLNEAAARTREYLNAHILNGTSPESGSEVEVDAFVSHLDLQDCIQKRVSQGWTQDRLMECKAKNDMEYCTIIWRKR